MFYLIKQQLKKKYKKTGDDTQSPILIRGSRLNIF